MSTYTATVLAPGGSQFSAKVDWVVLDNAFRGMEAGATVVWIETTTGTFLNMAQITSFVPDPEEEP